MRILLNVSTCCFVIPLKTGVLIISVTNFFASLLALGVFFYLSIDTLKEINNLTDDISLPPSVTIDEAYYLNVSYGAHIFQCIVALLLIIMSVILFYGTIRENPSLVMIWLLYSTIHTIAMSFSIILTSINNFKAGNHPVAFVAIGVIIFIAVLTWYYLSVVFRFYIEIRDGSPTCTVSTISQPDSSYCNGDIVIDDDK